MSVVTEKRRNRSVSYASFPRFLTVWTESLLVRAFGFDLLMAGFFPVFGRRLPATTLQENFPSLLGVLRESAQLNLAPPGYFLLLRCLSSLHIPAGSAGRVMPAHSRPDADCLPTACSTTS